MAHLYDKPQNLRLVQREGTGGGLDLFARAKNRIRPVLLSNHFLELPDMTTVQRRVPNVLHDLVEDRVGSPGKSQYVRIPSLRNERQVLSSLPAHPLQKLKRFSRCKVRLVPSAIDRNILDERFLLPSQAAELFFSRMARDPNVNQRVPPLDRVTD